MVVGMIVPQLFLAIQSGVRPRNVQVAERSTDSLPKR
jgi:hypothetical protein